MNHDQVGSYCCVSAPVFSADGSVRESLAVTLPPSRFELEESALVAQGDCILLGQVWGMVVGSAAGASPAKSRSR